MLDWGNLTRAFLNLWFAKAMVCTRVSFHETHGENHANDENDEDNSDSYKIRS